MYVCVYAHLSAGEEGSGIVLAFFAVLTRSVDAARFRPDPDEEDDLEPKAKTLDTRVDVRTASFRAFSHAFTLLLSGGAGTTAPPSMELRLVFFLPEGRGDSVVNWDEDAKLSDE